MRSRDIARARPLWADVRFLLGVVLVGASILGVWAIVAASRQTTPILAAAHTIAAGERVAADDLQVVEVALGHLDDAYATPGRLEPGAVAVRTIGSGELVPAAALIDAESAETTTVVVQSSTPVPASMAVGDGVDLWAAAQTERGVYDEPQVLVPQATVLAVAEDDAVVGVDRTRVELVIDRDDVAAVLGAVVRGDALSVVPRTAGR